MRSSMPKVLHPLAGQSLLAHVLDAAPQGRWTPRWPWSSARSHEAVAAEAKRVRPDAATFVQRERLGTAHAVLAARDAIARGADDLLVVFGDTPLISAATLAAAARAAEQAQRLPCSDFARPIRPATADCWSRETG